MGYIWPKVWDILGKNYGIYYGKYLLKIVGYILQNYVINLSIGYSKPKLRNVLVKILGYRKVKLWDILWDIFDKNLKEYICKTMGFIQKNYGINRAETMGYIGLRL